MNDEILAEQFEIHRVHLRSVAYRMLGSLSDAEDAVQEAWLRLSRYEGNSISNVGGWLTTVVSRICLDMLRARKASRETTFDAGQALNNMGDGDAVGRTDPEQEAMLAESVGLALLVVLDALSPAERITFVLHDVFSMPFSEISPIVGKSEAAVRQLASRARRRVKGGETAGNTDLDRQRELVSAFLAAARAGDFGRLVSLLDPDVVLRDDRSVASASLTRGAEAIAGQVAGRAKAAQLAQVNGTAGIVAAPYGKLLYVIHFVTRGGKIAEIDLISNPKRIRQLTLRVW